MADTLSNLATKDANAAGAAVAAPGVGATVVTLGVLPKGTYRVSFTVQNAGTAETTAAGLQNMALRHGTTVICAIPTTGQAHSLVVERVTVSGAESINIASVAAAIAGSIYVAALTAVKLGS